MLNFETSPQKIEDPRGEKTYKSCGRKPVAFASRANIRGPISTFS